MKRSFSSGLYENSMLFDDFTEASISASFSLRKKRKKKTTLLYSTITRVTLGKRLPFRSLQ